MRMPAQNMIDCWPLYAHMEGLCCMSSGVYHWPGKATKLQCKAPAHDIPAKHCTQHHNPQTVCVALQS